MTDRGHPGHRSAQVPALAFELSTRGVSGSARNAQSRERRVERVFRAEYPFVRRVLKYWGVPPGALEDAVQDVFVVVTRRLDELRPGVDVRSWLLGIARRVARNQRRTALRMRVRRAFLRSMSEPDPPRCVSTRHHDVDLALRLLQTLPERQRVVFVLADLEGWTAPEIAEGLGIKLNTVYSRLRLARSRLEAEHARIVAAAEEVGR